MGSNTLAYSAPRPLRLPEASSVNNPAALEAAALEMELSTPRSNRFDASDGSLWRLALLAIEIGSKIAASIRTDLVLAPTSVRAPPITPAIPIGPCSSQISKSSS